MKTPNCFGCSFTQGIYENTCPLFPRETSIKLLTMVVEVQVYCGPIYLMEKFSKIDDIDIF